MSTLVADALFAPIDTDLHLERIAGGNETEVYRTDNQRYVVKVKSELPVAAANVLTEVASLRTAATAFTQAVGVEHSIPSHYVISRNSEGQVQALVLQPFLENARPLYHVDYRKLTISQRRHLADQLRAIIRRSLEFYRKTEQMPDLYGRTSASHAERKRLNAPLMLPWRLWSFLVKRNLLRSHNLMLTAAPDHRVVLVDYDPVRRSKFYRLIYYRVRQMLFWRDRLLIALMERGWFLPKTS